MQPLSNHEPGPAHSERPYRSHLQPACLSCRQRKSRCQTEPGGAGGPCLMCRAHGTACVYPEQGEQNRDAKRPAAAKSQRVNGRKRPSTRDKTPYRIATDGRVPLPSRAPGANATSASSSADAHGSTVHGLSGGKTTGHAAHQQPSTDEDDTSALEFGSADDHALNLHIVGPAMTKDSQVLSDYLCAIPGAVTRGSRMVVPVPASRSRPVLFHKVMKRPVGVPINRSPSAEKLEIIEKLLEPYTLDVIDVYFRKVNSCFPVLDEVSFRRQYHENKERISPALLACLYAHTLVHWPHSHPLSKRRCPDSRFIWNLANDAVYSELHLAPGMSMIKAIIFNIGGLPTTSLIGNGVLMGSAVSLAYSLGLNHSPLAWDVPVSEKYLRMKIWWALLVHDRWLSLAHGTPPRLSKSQNDVPPPTLEYICGSAGTNDDQLQQRDSAAIFIALVGLTNVLDQHLQFIYQVDRDRTSPANLELELNTWVESLAGSVRLIILRGSYLDIPGAPNLRFSYLTARLLLQRIQLEADKQEFGPENRRVLNGYLQARRTAEDIILMTQEFQPRHLGDYWLSPHAFSYFSTVTFLLRCALEMEHSPADLVQSASFRLAHDLVNTLRKHQEEHSWNIGDLCLAQYSELVDKIFSGVSQEPQGPAVGVSNGNNNNNNNNNGGDGDTSGHGIAAGFGFDVNDMMVLPDASIIDQFFPSLWDPLQMQNTW